MCTRDVDIFLRSRSVDKGTRVPWNFYLPCVDQKRVPSERDTRCLRTCNWNLQMRTPGCSRNEKMIINPTAGLFRRVNRGASMKHGGHWIDTHAHLHSFVIRISIWTCVLDADLRMQYSLSLSSTSFRDTRERFSW